MSSYPLFHKHKDFAEYALGRKGNDNRYFLCASSISMSSSIVLARSMAIRV